MTDENNLNSSEELHNSDGGEAVTDEEIDDFEDNVEAIFREDSSENESLGSNNDAAQQEDVFTQRENMLYIREMLDPDQCYFDHHFDGTLWLANGEIIKTDMLEHYTREHCKGITNIFPEDGSQFFSFIITFLRFSQFDPYFKSLLIDKFGEEVEKQKHFQSTWKPRIDDYKLDYESLIREKITWYQKGFWCNAYYNKCLIIQLCLLIKLTAKIDLIEQLPDNPVCYVMESDIETYQLRLNPLIESLKDITQGGNTPIKKNYIIAKQKDIDQWQQDNYSETRIRYLTDHYESIWIRRAKIMSFNVSDNYYFSKYTDKALLHITRLTARQIAELTIALGVPSRHEYKMTRTAIDPDTKMKKIIKSTKKVNVDPIFQVIVFLARLTSKTPLRNLSEFFGKDINFLSNCELCVSSWIYINYKKHLDANNLTFPDSYVKHMSEKSNKFETVRKNTVFFVDGTHFVISKPTRYGESEDMEYNGRSGNSLSYQGICNVDGLFVHIIGPGSGREHDMTMIENESFVWLDNFAYEGEPFKLLGDAGYMSELFTQSPNIYCITRQSISDTMLQKQQRKEEAMQRVINEMSFGFLKQMFPSAENATANQLFGTHVNLKIISSFMMSNCFRLMGKGPCTGELPKHVDLCLYLGLCGERSWFKFDEYM